jgi:indolepyruvate ferredoxin oxidoreductase
MRVDPRFLTADGPEIFNGSELLLKGCLEAEGGVHLLGGYPGSPTAGFFDSMARIKDLLNSKGIRALMNSNEALAAAMLNGSQALGCRAVINMKSVGVHVAADALALGNLAGAHREGGAVVVYGDDPWSDSTQVPADSRYISKHLFIPVIEPADPQEVKDFVDLALKVSRGSELFSGFILPTNLADGGGTVRCRANQYPAFNTVQKLTLDTSQIDLDKRVLLPPRTWWQEESFPRRHRTAVEIARRLGLNRIENASDSVRPVGFVTSGMAYGYLRHALWEMGMDGQAPILKLGMSYPLDGELVRALAGQCRAIVVVEERRGFIEEQVAQVVLADRQSGGLAGEVVLWGKQFPAGLPGIPATRGLHPSILIDRLVPMLRHANGGGGGRLLHTEWDEGLDRETRTITSTARVDVGEVPARLPTFCPGCPHRDSAALCLDIKKRFMDGEYMRRKHGRGPVDLVFHGDTGCYTMLMFPPTSDLMHDYSGMGLGGGTGVGTDPFITNKEAVFMGDSTFFHSGQLAISQAVKLGQDITFIILDNATTAMTGHQPTPGLSFDIIGNPTAVQDIEEIVSGMTGDSGLSVVRVDPEKREQYCRLLESTFLADGVKVIIADKECAITRGRRKRREEQATIRQVGYLPVWKHMNVNLEACTFCLSCAEMTGCPGLKHTETDYGPKMDTDITWCVNDGACERIGACGAFEEVTVRRKRPPRTRVPELGLDDIPEPDKRDFGDLWRCCLTGVGGMGLGVATSIIVRAGHKEGYDVRFLDKKGLAIRNGGTVSQVAYLMASQPVTALIPYGKADLLIGIDVLEAARALDPRGRMRVATRERTAAVVNTDKIPTINGILGNEDFDPDRLERMIREHTRAEDYLARNIARICESYLGSKLYANVMMLGFAFQKGLIPVSMHSMAWAIKDTISTDFRKNLYAFNMGRKLVVQGDLFQGPPVRTAWCDTLEDKCRATIRRYRNGQALADSLREVAAGTAAALEGVDEETRRNVVVRIYDCMRWGGIRHARRYAKAVTDIFARDSSDYGYAATRAVVYNLADAMLIKDAVFLAELATSPEKQARDARKYNVNRANGDTIHYRHLWHVDWRIGPWSIRRRLVMRTWMLRVLRGWKWLRRALPRWHGQETTYVLAYEHAIAAFRGGSPLEYQASLLPLASAECMNCPNPRCKEAGCPADSEISKWLLLAYQGRWREACVTLHEKNNFPEFTSRICPAPCQAACKQALRGFAVQIKDIESRIVDKGFGEGWIAPAPAERKTGRSVAVVGSGPAGLACAQQLARAGHDVTVFEKDDAPGGLLRYGIPDFRLEKALVDRRIEQLAGEGVTVRTGCHVGADVPAGELLNEFDAVCLAVGARRARGLDVPGADLPGVHGAMDLLRQQNLRAAGKAVPPGELIDARGKTVVVIGGGDTGADCVDALSLQGAAEIHQFEILPRPADGEQADHGRAVEQSPALHRRWKVRTLGFAGQDGRVEQIAAMRVNWLNTPDGPQMEPVAGSEFRMKVDLVILATGFEPVVGEQIARQLRLATDERGRAIVSDCRTSQPGVFAAGDLVTGPALVVAAIDSGRRAADKIDQYLARAAAPQQALAGAM